MQNDWIYSNSPTFYYYKGTYLVKHKNFKISYLDRGIVLYLRVDDNNTEIQGSSGTVTNGDVSISVSYKLFPDVNYINIIHTVTNNGDKNHEVDFRCYSDIAIEGSDGSIGDNCPERNIEGNRGVEFINGDRTVRFLLRDFPFVTNVDAYSYTNCPGVGSWSNCTEYIQYIERGAGIRFSWQNQQIKPHESKNYSYSIGMGEYYKAHQLILTQKQDCYDPHTEFSLDFAIDSIRTDTDLELTIKRLIDDTNEQTVKTLTDKGSQMTFSDKLTLSQGHHTIKYITTDSRNGKSELLIPIIVTKKPTITSRKTIQNYYESIDKLSFDIDLYDDSFAIFKIFDDQNTLFFNKSINCRGQIKNILDTIDFLKSPIETVRKISIVAVDEFGVYSNFINFTVNNEKPFIRLSEISTPIQLIQKNLRIYTDILLMSGSTTARIYSSINTDSYSLMRTLNDLTPYQWKSVSFGFDVKDIPSDGNNTFKLYVQDSNNFESSPLLQSLILIAYQRDCTSNLYLRRRSAFVVVLTMK